MKKLWRLAVSGVLALAFPISAAAIAAPVSGCSCPNGDWNILSHTTWGAAPGWTCGGLAELGRSSAEQSAAEDCGAAGVCAFVVSNESCVDQGGPDQHFSLDFRWKCYVCSG